MFSNFKFHLKGITLVILSVAFIWACKKNDHPSTIKIPATSEGRLSNSLSADLEFLKRIKAKFEQQNLHLADTINDTTRIVYLPAWRMVKEKQEGKNNYLYVPLKPILSIRNQPSDKMLNQLGVEQFLIVKIDSISNVSFLKAKYEPIKYIKNRPIDYEKFSGRILLSNFQSTILLDAQNGISRRVISKRDVNGRIICDMECTWARWCQNGITVTYTVGYDGYPCAPPFLGMEEIDCGGSVGTSGTWQPGLSSLVNCHQDLIDPILPPIPPTNNPNAGGGPGDPTPVTGLAVFLDFTNNLQNPCFREVYSDFRNNANGLMPNKIMNMLNDFFIGNPKIQVTIQQDKFITVLGTPERQTDGHCDVVLRNGIYYMTVTLNENAIGNSSKQTILATLIHELCHGVMSIEGVDDYFQHNEMGMVYVSEMGKLIWSAYPSSTTVWQAYDLAWGGVQKSYSYLILPSASKVSIVLTNDYFKNGPYGVYCQ